MQASPGNASTPFKSLSEQSQRPMRKTILPIPPQQHINSLPILQFIVEKQPKRQRLNNHVFLLFCFCCFCSDLTTAKSRPHVQTNTRANSPRLQNQGTSGNYFGPSLLQKKAVRSLGAVRATAELPEEFGRTGLR